MAVANAISTGTNSEHAHFTITNITTGTWVVDVTSGAYTLHIASVVVGSSITVPVPNSVTVATWPVSGYSHTILKSTTSGGFVEGYVYGDGSSYWTPIPGILVEANSVSARTASNGYYVINTTTGAVTVNANFNGDSPGYVKDSYTGVTAAGGYSILAPYPYFHLGTSGTLYGWVTSGTIIDRAAIFIKIADYV